MSEPETPKDETPEKPAEPEQEPEQEQEQEYEYPIPPPTFDYLVFSLRAQTEMHLGLMHFGEEKDKPKPNLRLAQHTIDMMATLAEKTKGNLSLEEQRYLENSLTELRFRYVQVAEESKR